MSDLNLWAMKALFANWRRTLAESILHRLVTNELLKQLAKRGVDARLGKLAISRLVVEIIDHAQGASHDSTKKAGQEVLKQAEKIALEVGSYFNDPQAGEPAMRRILDFHVDSLYRSTSRSSSDAQRAEEIGELQGQRESDSARLAGEGPSLSHVVAILSVGFAVSAAVMAIVSAIRR